MKIYQVLEEAKYHLVPEDNRCFSYCCHAVLKAANVLQGTPENTGAGDLEPGLGYTELGGKTTAYLKSLGMPLISGFRGWEDEDRQAVRFAWLDFAEQLAREEDV